MTKRIYLSGPMTGIPDHNFPAFHEWAARLRAQGYEVVSPAELSEGKTWVECLRVDVRELCGCGAIALMPGWEASKGANLELHVAHRLELEVIPLAVPECTCAAKDMPFGRCCNAPEVAALQGVPAEPLVDENCPADIFENALRKFGVVAACEWFGYAADDPFVAVTQRVLRERADSRMAALVRPVPQRRAQDALQARYEARYKGPGQ